MELVNKDNENNEAEHTLSPAPVAPSISSIINKTGLVLPTADPDSRAGRIRSSTMDPERASLQTRVKLPHAWTNDIVEQT